MINYIKGDAVYPERVTPNSTNIIVHIVNDIGAWGAGFVLALSRRTTIPEFFYKTHFRNRHLGDIDLIQISQKTFVCNLVGQHGVMSSSSKSSVLDVLRPFPPKTVNKSSQIVPVRYDAIRLGLRRLKTRLEGKSDVVIHMPRIGCGLAGGDWSIVSKIVEETLKDMTVYVHDL